MVFRQPRQVGKYYEKYLASDLWDELLKTYSDAGIENTWQALFTMCGLFRRLALRVADHFEFDYPSGDDHRVSAHLRHVRQLPASAR